METVEVWMWIIAGLLITSMILASSFSLVGRHLRSQARLDCADQFTKLYNMIGTQCIGGVGSSETKEFIIPFLMQKIYVKNESNAEGYGDILCYKIDNELPFCRKIKGCDVTMNTLGLSYEEGGLFSNIVRTLGRGKVSTVSFTVSKVSFYDVNVTWQREFSK